MKQILEAKNISKKFLFPREVSVLKDINLIVNGGESIAIMGRSGEGKSTLLQILGTLELPTTGKIFISQKEMSSSNLCTLRRDHLAFVFQSYHLLEDATVLENILMPAKIKRKPTFKGSEAYERAIDLLEIVKLSHRMNFNTKLLSGGEKQRVAIARAFCNNPDLILADEPSGNLDHATADLIHTLLLDFAKDPNKALILVTHNKTFANLCKKTFILENGTLVG